MKYLIYKVTNKINGKSYIGKHQTNDVNDDYMGSGKHLKYAQNKYGIDNFNKEILYIFNSEEEMNNMEREIVDEDFILREDTYNLVLGGDGGFNYINSNNLNNSNNNHNKARREHLELIETDSVYKDEWTKKIKEGIQKVIDSGDYIPGSYCLGKPNAFRGKNHTEDSKTKISESKKGTGTGKSNSQFGTCWIHNLNLKKSKRIKKDGLKQYIDKGWIKGAKFKW